jgi:SPP1 family predicted phage head-tail adaptor
MLGEWVDTYADYVTVWAAIEPLSGTKYFQAQQANSDVTGVIRIRYRSDLESDMRIKYTKGGITRYFLIVSFYTIRDANAETQIMYREQLD